MTVAYVIQALDDALTDEQIERDVLNLLWESSVEGAIALEIDEEETQGIAIA
ncbi:MAG: hypothetical protein F6J93_02050 [Oscillatoria sp. SIO1A7]|nr:hypothetical protein [Oscillatoria sp. SIO1A7]